MNLTYILLIIFFLLKPWAAVDFRFMVAGFNYLDLINMLILGLLFGSLLIRAAVGKALVVSNIQIAMLIYILWCIASVVVYPQYSDYRQVVRWVSPFITYIVVVNVINNMSEYRYIMGLLFRSTFLAIIGSVIIIVAGGGIAEVEYFSGVVNYKGLFSSSGLYAHHSALFLMLSVMTFMWKKEKGAGGSGKGIKAVFQVLSTATGFIALYTAKSRTTLFTAPVFVLAMIYKKDRRVLILALIILILVLIVKREEILAMFTDFIRFSAGEVDVGRIGSGRPRIWQHNIEEFADLPFERQLMGGGIGYSVPVFSFMKETNFWTSHNDYLDVLIQTGYVGFVLYMVVLVMIAIKIFRSPQPYKYGLSWFLLVTLIVAITSPSYYTQYAISQFYFMVLAVLEIVGKNESNSVENTG